MWPWRSRLVVAQKRGAPGARGASPQPGRRYNDVSARKVQRMFDFLTLLVAAGGGLFGAAIGGLHAFIFTGFVVLVGMAIVLAGGSPEFLNYVAFGPAFGPHIAFAGGVAAAAYAARVSKDIGGKDIGAAPLGLDRPVVLLVGAVFGVFGYVVQTG